LLIKLIRTRELPFRSFFIVSSVLEFDSSTVSESQQDFFTFSIIGVLTSPLELWLHEQTLATISILQSINVVAKLKLDKISKNARPDTKYFFILEFTKLNYNFTGFKTRENLNLVIQTLKDIN